MRLDELLAGDVSVLVCGNLDAAAVVRLGFASKTLWGAIGQKNIVRDGVLREFSGIVNLPMGKSANVYLIFLSLYYAPKCSGSAVKREMVLIFKSIRRESFCFRHDVSGHLGMFFQTRAGRACIIKRAENLIEFQGRFSDDKKAEQCVKILSKIVELARSSFCYNNMLMSVAQDTRL